MKSVDASDIVKDSTNLFHLFDDIIGMGGSKQHSSHGH